MCCFPSAFSFRFTLTTPVAKVHVCEVLTGSGRMNNHRGGAKFRLGPPNCETAQEVKQEVE